MFPMLARLVVVTWQIRWRVPRHNSPATVWGGTLALAMAACAYVLRFSSPCPVQDEWDSLGPLLAHPVRWSWIWDYHNEHRFVLGKTIWSLVLLATGFQFRIAGLVSVAILIAATVAMLGLTRKIRGRTRLVDLLIPIILLHWGHSFNWLMSYQLAFTLVVLCAVGLLGVAVRCQPGREFQAGCWATFALSLAIQNGGFGLAIAPPVLLWIAYLAVRTTRRSLSRATILGFLLLLPCAYLLLTVLNQPRSQVITVRPGFAEFVMAVAGYLAMALGPWIYQPAYLWLPSYFLAAFYLFVGIVALQAFRTQPAERPRLLGLLAVLAGHFITAVGIVWSRGGAWAIHYPTGSCVGLCAAWLILLLYGPRLDRRVAAGLLAAGLGILAITITNGYRQGIIQRSYLKGMLTELSQGMPPRFVSGKYSGQIIVTPNSRVIFGELRDRNVEPYARAVFDPPMREQPLALPERIEGWDEVGQPPVVCIPAIPQQVYGLRVTVDCERGSAWSCWELSWTNAHGERRTATAFPPTFVTREHEVLFWVNDTAREVRLTTRCPSFGYSVRSAGWLVPTTP